MTRRTRDGSPRLHGRGPAVRAVTVLRLVDERGYVELPRPTMQYGGVYPYPTGTVLRIDIGKATHCTDWAMENLAGALVDCAEIEVVGTDSYGVSETRQHLCRALSAEVSPAC
ncbi:hypothetical protein [Streptomyces sp. SM1]|uniref:hypothetical protein n=1 Tax=Streptomyces sp. SM1 TaxID=402229 RepID=UPI000CD5B653|nr:hypothetical protein [Streptomyces sp. SM1]